MNLSGDVLRWIARRMLVNRTWAADRVYDSQVEEGELGDLQKPEPLISVYTDGGSQDLDGENLWGGTPTVDITFEIAVAGPQTVQLPADQGGGQVQIVEVLQTAAAHEVTLGFIWRQIMAALSRVDDPWADLFRQLAWRRRRIQMTRAAQEERGPRAAARQYTITVEVLEEPVPGQPVPEGFWADFIALASADPQMRGLAQLLVDHIKGADILSDWHMRTREVTAFKAEAKSLGYGSLDTDTNADIPWRTMDNEIARDVAAALADDDGYILPVPTGGTPEPSP